MSYRGLSTLSVVGVSDYLRSIGKPFESYIDSFAGKFVNGVALCNLNDSDLTELGVRDRFHRIRILADAEQSMKVAAVGTFALLSLTCSTVRV